MANTCCECGHGSEYGGGYVNRSSWNGVSVIPAEVEWLCAECLREPARPHRDIEEEE